MKDKKEKKEKTKFNLAFLIYISSPSSFSSILGSKK